jgi:hypothetical protein
MSTKDSPFNPDRLPTTPEPSLPLIKGVPEPTYIPQAPQTPAAPAPAQPTQTPQQTPTK